LAISRNYARLMGGDITVTSRLGEGSTFRLEVDIQVGNESDLREAAQEPTVLGLAPGQVAPRVMVVDDKAENRIPLVKLLEMAGFSVLVAQDGEAAVASFASHGPHFIWMDIRMPGIGGLEATRRIRALPGGDTVKIAALTASVMDEERDSILAAGCDDFVSKPCRNSVLFKVMAKHLGVTYRYDNATKGAPCKPAAGLNPGAVALPAALREELLSAVLELHTSRTLEVVEKIAQRDAALGTLLEELARNLEYDRILKLLEG
jgi:CheY-like chemotaxis protein